MTTESDKQRALRRKTFEQWEKEKNYQALLNELLAECHRDGGQYTAIAGVAASTFDAMDNIRLLRRKVGSMFTKSRRV